MAVCFMVSSAKREIDKMEKILRETENLVSFMGRELAERKFQSGSTGEDDDLFTDITEATVGRISAPKNVEKHINNLSNNGSFEGPLTRTGPIADTSQNHMHECNSEAADRVPSHDKVIDSEIGDTNNGQQQVIHGWDFKNENDYGGESDSECVISLIELQKSLWAVFHQIQEEKVSELEATLKSALHKLHIKEEEACWWKRLAYHLMEQFDSSIDGLQSGFPVHL
ncbi:hypothetical protein KP509_33G006700 [Ceratopteris richardii]|uniref:Uncharacterized protein n=1 Tax=Ceratopteris richardii TaxID=49495 RepID=A0A8T2QLU6_CERRI|nr:hypothetical protein KP509_33G006700 [Ceratopteris richardii]